MKLLVLLLVCAVLALTEAKDSPVDPPQNELNEKDYTKPEAVVETEVADGASEGLGNAVKRSSGKWHNYNGHSYIFIAYAKSWPSAQQECLTLGGHLATIRDRSEENFVKSVAGGKTAWIGLSDGQANGWWFWIDSSPRSYTNWCRGQPDNKWNQECAVINFSRDRCWDDQDCNKDRRPFVCEKKL